MAGVDIGAAYIAVLPSTSKLGPEVTKALGGAAKGADKQGATAGRKFADGFKSMASKAVKGGMLAAAAGVTALGVAGVRSAVGMEKSRKTLAGLYGSAKDADSMMRSLRDVAKASPIEYKTYTKGAEALAYMGLKGKEASSILKNVGASVVAAGGGSEEMGRATNAMLNMVNAGKVQLDTLNQLSGAGAPIFSGLAAHFNTNIANVREMVTAGKVGIDDVMSVMQNATGDNFKQALAANEEVTKTLSAQWAIAKDNIATALGAMLEPLLVKVTPALAAASSAVTDFVEGMQEGTGAGGRFADQARDIGGVLKPIASGAASIAKFFASNLKLTVSLVAAFAAYKAVTLGVRAAQSAAAIATSVWTVAQQGLNAAMRANPIGLIVAGLTLLVGGLVLAYQKSETFRNIVDSAWAGIKTAFKSAWKLIKPIFAAYKFYITGVLIPAFKWLWSKAVKPVMGFIGKHIRGVWVTIIKPAFNGLSRGVGLIRTAFSRAKDGIVRAWNKIKSAAKTPVKFVVNKVINPLAKGINKILPGDPIPTIKGFRKGGWTGYGGLNDPAGVVHAREYVLRAEAVKKLMRQSPRLLDHLNQTGELPPPYTDFGYRKGGLVKPLRTLRVTSPFGMRGGRLHAGVDFGAPTGTPIYAAKGGTVGFAGRASGYGNLIAVNHGGGFVTRYAHMYDNGVLTRQGRKVSAGSRIGKVGSFGRSTGPHLHFETRFGGVPRNPMPYLRGAAVPSGKESGSAWDWLKGKFNFKKKMAGFLDKIRGKGGMFGPSLFKFAKDIGSKIWDSIKSKIGNVTGYIGGAAKRAGGVGKKIVKKLKFFDEGGLASGVGPVWKNTPQPERVLSPAQTVAFEAALSRGFEPKSKGGPEYFEAKITNWETGVIRFERMVDGRIRDDRSLVSLHGRQF